MAPTPYSRAYEVITSDLYVLRCSHKRRIMHTHNCMEFGYVESGSAFHVMECDGKQKTDQLKSGSYILMDMRCRHSFENCSEDFSIINVLFQPTFIKETMNGVESLDYIIKKSPFFFDTSILSQSPVNNVLYDETGEIFLLFNKINTSFTDKTYGYEALIKCYLSEIILYSCQKFIVSNACRTKKHDAISTICAIVAEHYADKITLTQICKDNFFSLPYISKKFKEIQGVSFEQYLQQVRITNACNMLVETSLPIETVAGAVGYNDSKSFRKIFIKLTGKTPGEYRKHYYSNS